MSIWVVGDVHGCYQSLLELLAAIRWDPSRDRLWLTGDLVNRGPRSLDVLRWARKNDRAVTAVLGNHDLWFLGRAMGLGRPKKREKLAELLTAPDRDDLVHWLARRPLLHCEDGHALVHAGLWPSWSLPQALALAQETTEALRGPQAKDLLAVCAKNDNPVWTEGSEDGPERLGRALSVFTGLRMVGDAQAACPSFTGAPEDAPPECRPWYEERRPQVTILFGHWAALGHRKLPGAVSLDTGCVYGGQLTALRLEDGAVCQQRSLD